MTVAEAQARSRDMPRAGIPAAEAVRRLRAAIEAWNRADALACRRSPFER